MPSLKRRRDVPLRATCTNALKQRFLHGEINTSDAIAELITIGWASDYAPEMLQGWTCELKARSKQASLSALCQWYERGTLTTDEYVERLTNLGWSDEDITRIIVECQSRINDKKRKQAEREAKAALAKERREAKEAEQAQRRQEAQMRRRASELERMTRASIRRDKAIAKAAEKYSKLRQISLADALSAIRAAWRISGDGTPLGLDERIAVVSLAVDALKADENADLEFTTRTIAAQFVDFPEQFLGRNGSTSST